MSSIKSFLSSRRFWMIALVACLLFLTGRFAYGAGQIDGRNEAYVPPPVTSPTVSTLTCTESYWFAGITETTDFNDLITIWFMTPGYRNLVIGELDPASLQPADLVVGSRYDLTVIITYGTATVTAGSILNIQPATESSDCPRG